MLIKLLLKESRKIFKNKLLFLVIVSLTSILTFSNYLAFFTNAIGMNSALFPILICFMLYFACHYMSQYLFKEYSNELGILSSLGISKKKVNFLFLSALYIAEIYMYFVGAIIGIMVALILKKGIFPHIEKLTIYKNGAIMFQNTLFFMIAISISFCLCYMSVNRKSINNMLYLKESTHKGGMKIKKVFLLFLISSILLTFCIIGLGLNDFLLQISSSGILIFAVISIFCFYRIVYFGMEKLKNNSFRKADESIYIYSNLLKSTRKSVVSASFLSICLLFGYISYACGFLLITIDKMVFPGGLQTYFSLIQICISIIFIFIYFIILSMDIIGEKEQIYGDLKIIGCLGINILRQKLILVRIIVIRLLLPSLAFGILMLVMNTKVLSIIQSHIGAEINHIGLVCSFAVVYGLCLMGYILILYRAYTIEKQ